MRSGTKRVRHSSAGFDDARVHQSAALAHCIRHHSIEANRCQRKPEDAEQAAQGRVSPFVRCAAADHERTRFQREVAFAIDEEPTAITQLDRATLD